MRIWKRMLAATLAVLMVCTGMTISAKADASDYDYYLENNQAVITGYYGTDTEITIPSKLDGYTVTGIDEYAFFAQTELQKIVVPGTVTTIGENAFAVCWDLREITLPDSITTLGDGAFNGCLELQSIKIPKNIKELGASMFDTCAALTKVELPAGMTSIGNGAFNECSALESITLPGSLTTIEDDAFINCTALKTVTVPKSVTQIGEYAFGYKRSPGGTYSVNGITIKGNKGTAAQTYATENGFQFVDVAASAALPFTDVKRTDWFYFSVKEAYELGIMSGYSDNTFRPNNTMNRAMVVTVLHRLAGYPKASYKNMFSDVPSGQYYTSAVMWAAQNKIVNGYADQTFRPDAIITREQLATMLMNFAKSQGMDVSGRANLAAYKDQSAVSSYARNAISWAIASGIMSGNGAGEIAPQKQATRAEATKMLLQFSKLMEK